MPWTTAAHAIRPPPRRPVRRRAGVCLLAALIALMNWGWTSTISPFRTIHPAGSGITINGTRIDLSCHGRDSPTVVVIGEPLSQPLLSPAVREELTHFVRLCILTVQETATRRPAPNFADVLRGLLIGGHVPGPYAFIAYGSDESVSTWVSGPLAAQTAGYVLIGRSPEASSIAVRSTGEWWPIPTGDRDDTVLAMLMLFWPSDRDKPMAPAP
jgi:hypothetical protein